jgi:hypothetical protein
LNNIYAFESQLVKYNFYKLTILEFEDLSNYLKEDKYVDFKDALENNTNCIEMIKYNLPDRI